MKFNLKLKNEKIIGPKSHSEIIRLFDDGEIRSDDLVQRYPDGEWRELKFSLEFKELDFEKTESSYLQLLDGLDRDDTTSKTLSDEIEMSDAERLEEQILNEPDTDSQESNIDIDESVENHNDQNTTVIQDDPYKTVINKDTLEYLKQEEERKKQEEIEAQKRKEEEEREQKKQELIENISSESTRVLNLNETKLLEDEDLDLNVDIDNIEKELEEQELQAFEEKVREDALIEELEDEEELDPAKGKRKKIIIIVAVLALAFLFLDPEKKTKETKKKYKPVKVKLLFPVAFDEADVAKSEKYYKSGLKKYKTYRYDNMAYATALFRLSLENNPQNKDALLKMILSYADLLKFINNKPKELTVFKLIQIYEQEYFDNVDYVLASALFYNRGRKYNSTVKVVKKYLETGKNPNYYLYAVFLEALYQSGDFEKAKEVYNALRKQKIKNPFVYAIMIDYKMLLNDYKDAAKLLLKSLLFAPKSNILLHKKIKLLFYNEDYASIVEVLKLMKSTNFENSPYYFVKYLTHYATLNLIQKKGKEAQKLFEQALKIEDSPEIRSKIASIKVDELPSAKNLILESKSIELIRMSKDFALAGDWKKAIAFAIDAYDIAPHYVPAQIYLAKVHARQGNFKIALERLRKIYSANPNNKDVSFALLDTYIQSYKFGHARRLLVSLGTTDLKDHYLYASYQGKMFLKMGLIYEAIKWFQKSINRNPINDEDYYNLATVFLKKRLYTRAIVMLSKAIELNSNKSEYHVLYSKVLYEQQNAQTAIGYLKDALKEFPYDTKLLAEIAINYFKVGKMKLFEATKAKLEKLPKDGTLYKFLMDAAVLEGNWDDVIKYGNELLIVEPGDLKTKMLIGEIYMERGGIKNISKALEHFEYVHKKLDTYPKVKLNMAKINLLAGKIDDAKKIAKEEIKNNPELLDGYLLLAEIHLKENDFIKAQKNYQKAAQLNSESIDALSGLAYIHLKKNQLDVALDLYLKALTIEPSNAKLRKALGDVYRNLGQSALAIKTYKTYLELKPDSKFRAEIETYIRNFK